MNNVDLLRALQQSDLAWFLASTDHVITFASAGFERLTGYEPAELVGQNLAMFDVTGDGDNAQSQRDQVAQGRVERWHRRRPLRRKDGQLIWVDVVGNLARDHRGAVIGAVGAALDVSHEVTALAERDSWQKAHPHRSDRSDMLSRSVDEALIGQCVLDLSGLIIEGNAAASELFGRTRPDLLGRSFLSLVVPDDRARTDTILRTSVDASSANQTSHDLRVIRLDGEQRWARIWVTDVPDATGKQRWHVVQILDVTAEKKIQQRADDAERDLRSRLIRDNLTSTLNREGIAQHLHASLTTNPSGSTAVVYCDIDNFKEINDSMSHAVGDEVLQQVAERLRSTIRSDDVVGRIGGDEFVCVLNDVNNSSSVLNRASELQRTVASEPIVPSQRPVWVQISAGVAIAGGTVTPEQLLREADTALGQAKRRRSKAPVLYDDQMRLSQRAQLELASLLHDGLTRDEFLPWYQPQYRLRDGALTGYEALLRWERQDGTLTEANRFIDIAEDRGLIDQMGRSVLSAGIATAALLPPDVQMSINASPQELSHPHYLTHLAKIIAEHGMDPQRLAIEITERSISQSGQRVTETIHGIADLGVQIHVDDFGTGYSSLANLRDYPVSAIKLDASFTQMLDDPQQHSGRDLVAGLAELADRLGLERIAEGIEHEEQALALQELGWTVGQGYLFGAAQPADAL